MDASCVDCLFFRDMHPGMTLSGQCRRRPPVARVVSKDEYEDPVYEGVFPLIDQEDWCGEFRHKETGAGLQ
jgi:hypothetical protein